MSATPATTTSYRTLRQRVMAVARLDRTCTVAGGLGALGWQLGLPLLGLVLLQVGIGLPWYLRAPALPTVAVLLIWRGWVTVLRPASTRYGLTRAAMLVESRRPDLTSRVVSALELYPDLEAAVPRFDGDLITALVRYAQESTAGDDFTAVIDRRPAYRHGAVAALALVLWGGTFLLAPNAMWGAAASLVQAWGEVGDLLQSAAGAQIEIAAFDRAAFLVGDDVPISAVQRGFRRAAMDLCLRPASGGEWETITLPVDATGTAGHVVRAVAEPFEFYLAAGRIKSPRLTVTVTERPRIVTLSVEYTLPDYVRRAPIVQPRSDGNLSALYGSVIVLTIEANKEIAAARMTGSFLDQPEAFSIGGRYARAIIRLDDARWRAGDGLAVNATYRLELRDEFGYANADADREFRLDVVRDTPPVIAFTGLPNRSPADETHVLEENLAAVALAVRASDDYGVRKVTLHLRVEDLDTDRELRSDQRQRQFALPRDQIPMLRLLRLAEAGLQVGERLVFWAEAEDAYDLDTDKGCNRARTPAYRIAVVSQEALFSQIRYKDSWSVPWYDRQKIASLSRRARPERLAPVAEETVEVAARLLDAPPTTPNLRGRDRQLAQHYFDSLNSVSTP